MPLRLDIRRVLSCRSERVKSIELHPTEPWMLCSLYNGLVHIWNYESQSLVKSFDVCVPPVRCARFVARKNWIVTASDDAQIRVYNYNTKEKVKTIDAHVDYIRSVCVHPTHPYIISSSDDSTIRLFDWENDWKVKQIFEGHSHFVMMVVFNPRDANTFASAALDNTIRVWQLGSPVPNFTLEGHRGGVNCVGFFQGAEKPYLISGADDRTVKVWDYQTKTCIQTLTGHTDNVTAACFHPNLPIILTGSEDGTVRIWHSSTYRLENTLNYGLGRVWAIAFIKGSNHLALGCEHGSIMIKLGSEEPAMSMDQNGKIIWAKHNDIQQANAKMAAGADMEDGEPLGLAIKDLGSCEVYPHTLQHNPNGRFVVVCGDGEYIIYTALAWRNKGYGSALEFVWALDTGDYAVRENSSKVKVFKNFKESASVRLDFSAEGLFGGRLLGVRSSESLAFYDWGDQNLIMRIEVVPKSIYWSTNGDLCAICTADKYFILEYNKQIVQSHLEQDLPIPDDGIEDAFNVIGEITEIVQNGCWVGDCFMYTNENNRLNYFLGKNEKYEIVTVVHLEKPMHLLGYLPKENRLYLADTDFQVVSYALDMTILDYQTLVLRGDFASADSLLPKIPRKQRTRVAQFLEKQGFLAQAVQVTEDNDHKFELALQLKNMELAFKIAEEQDNEAKWKQLGDIALQGWIFDLAETCLARAKDYSGLLLLFSAAGNMQGLAKLAEIAMNEKKHNIAFVSLFLLHRLSDCLELLYSTSRFAEAAFFARTYMPSRTSEAVTKWKESLAENGLHKIAGSLADPEEYGNLFEDWDVCCEAESYLNFERRKGPIPASAYSEYKDHSKRNIVELLKSGALQAPAAGTIAPESPMPQQSTSTPPPQSPVPMSPAQPGSQLLRSGTPSGDSATASGSNTPMSPQTFSPQMSPKPQTPPPQQQEAPAATDELLDFDEFGLDDGAVSADVDVDLMADDDLLSFD